MFRLCSSGTAPIQQGHGKEEKKLGEIDFLAQLFPMFFIVDFPSMIM